jgi:hypothetical protein
MPVPIKEVVNILQEGGWHRGNTLWLSFCSTSPFCFVRKSGQADSYKQDESEEQEEMNIKRNKNKYFLAYMRRNECGGGLVTYPYISFRSRTTVNCLYMVH